LPWKIALPGALRNGGGAMVYDMPTAKNKPGNLMKQKNALALAAWNLYPLTRDPAVVSFLLKNDGDDILDVARELLAQSWQGAPDAALAATLQNRLIDYLWQKSDDENGEQGALELLAADGEAQIEEEESPEALTEDGAERAEEIDDALHTEENID